MSDTIHPGTSGKGVWNLRYTVSVEERANIARSFSASEGVAILV